MRSKIKGVNVLARVPRLPIAAAVSEENFGRWQTTQVTLSQESACFLKTYFGFDKIDIERPILVGDDFSDLSEFIASLKVFSVMSV